MQTRRGLLYGCFVASGAAGLTLEIVWSKYLSLLLGNSILGVSTVVAAFLGGLGIGAYLGGRVAGGMREPLLLYARIEAVVGLLGLVSPMAYFAAKPVFAWLYGALGGGGASFLIIRFLLLFAALLPPTIAMGASLPLLASDLTRRGDPFAPSVGKLYALNTAGAVLGVVAAGFLLVPALGLWRTAVAASALDIAVALAVMLGRPAAPPREDEDAGRAASVARLSKRAALREAGGPPARTAWSAIGRWIVPAFAASGFTAILYEIAWTRILTIPLGGMVYALSAILALYLLGIAAGSAAAAPLLRATSRPVVVFGSLQVLLAAVVGVGAHLFGEIPGWLASLVVSSSTQPARLFAGELAVTALVVLPPTLVLGALFPTAAAVYQRARGDAGASVGAIYAANTIGSIAGALLTGYVLIPAIGSLRSILLGAVLNLAIGIGALLAGEGPALPRRAAAAAAAAAGILFALLAPPVWSPQLMSIGFTRMLRAFRFGGEARGAQVVRELVETSGTAEGFERLRFYREGRLASVAVIDSPGRRALVVNGKPDATIGAGEDMMTQVLLAQLPLMIATKAQDVCVVGYGSGVTTHAVLTHPVRSAVTVEIEQAVVDAAPWFEEAASRPLADPRHSIVIEDAGTYLRSTATQFDLVISEPSNPWLAGVGDLFTREFYRSAAERVRDGGLFCQWVQCYEISQATLGTILRTLVGRFPHGHAFYFKSTNDLIIVASSDREIALDPRVMKAAFERRAVAQDLARAGVLSPGDLLRYYRGRLERLAKAAGPGPINTDDNGWLEHRAPLDLVRPQPRGEIFSWSGEVASDLAASLGADPESAAELLLEALDRAIVVVDRPAARGFAQALEMMQRPEVQEAWQRVNALEQRAALMAQAEEMMRTAIPILTQAADKGDPERGRRAAEILARAAALDPTSGEIAWRHGAALLASQRPAEAISELTRALGLLPRPRTFPVHRDLAAAKFFALDLEGSSREVEAMDKIRPGSGEARYWSARIKRERGDLAGARDEAARGLRADPDNARLRQLAAELGVESR